MSKNNVNLVLYFLLFLTGLLIALDQLVVFFGNQRFDLRNVVFVDFLKHPQYLFFAIGLIAYITFNSTTLIKKSLRTFRKFPFRSLNVTAIICFLIFLPIAFITRFAYLQRALLYKGDYIISGLLLGYILYQISEMSLVAKSENSSTDSTKERPIEKEEDDLINHLEVAEELRAQLIKDTSPCGKVIALYGRNGSGKTSVINLLKRIMTTDRFRFVMYEPYKFSNEKEMIRELFSALINGVNKEYYLLGSRSIPNRLIDIIYGASHPVLKGLMDYFIPAPSIEEIQSKIREAIMILNHKIVVVIDNIDRCSVNKRYKLFQVMNLIGKMENIYYIVAASPEELLNNSDPQLVSLVD